MSDDDIVKRPRGRPSLLLTEEERKLKQAQYSKEYYRKNREKHLQKCNDYYKNKIGGNYKYNSAHSKIDTITES